MSETQSIEVDYEIDEPIEKVWRALTDAALISDWLMKCDFRLEVGHKFKFTATPIPGKWDGVVDCEVLTIEPQHLLRYSWRGDAGTSGSKDWGLDTVVTWTVERISPSKTRLHLSHTGFTPANAFAFAVMGDGWRKHVAERMVATMRKGDVAQTAPGPA